MNNWIMWGLMMIVPLGVMRALNYRWDPERIDNGAPQPTFQERIQTNLIQPTLTFADQTVKTTAKCLMTISLLIGVSCLVAFLTNPILGVAVLGLGCAYALSRLR